MADRGASKDAAGTTGAEEPDGADVAVPVDYAAELANEYRYLALCPIHVHGALAFTQGDDVNASHPMRAQWEAAGMIALKPAAV